MLVISHFQASRSVKEMQSFREKLPAFKMKTEFLKAVAENQVHFSFTYFILAISLSDASHACGMCFSQEVVCTTNLGTSMYVKNSVFSSEVSIYRKAQNIHLFSI